MIVFFGPMRSSKKQPGNGLLRRCHRVRPFVFAHINCKFTVVNNTKGKIYVMSSVMEQVDAVGSVRCTSSINSTSGELVNPSGGGCSAPVTNVKKSVKYRVTDDGLPACSLINTGCELCSSCSSTLG